MARYGWSGGGRFVAVALVLLAGTVLPASSGAAGVALASGGVSLSNGRQITPAGRMVAAGDFPATGVLLNGDTAAETYIVANAGEGPNVLSVWEPLTLSATPVPHTDSAPAGSPDAQGGSIAVAPDGTHFFSSGGAGHGVMEFVSTPAAQVASVSLGTYVGGIAVDDAALFATLPFDSTRLYGKGNQVVRVALSAGLLPATPTITRATVGDMPTAIAVGAPPGGNEIVVVANRDSKTVSVLDATTLATLHTIPVGRQPAALAFAPGGADLYVIDSLDDELLDIETNTFAIHSRLALRAPVGLGAAPSALDVSPDGSTIYVALSSDNAIAVVSHASDTTGSRLALAGRIPTADYPTGVRLDRNNNQLLITSGKGVGVTAPLGSPVPVGIPVTGTQPVANPGPSGLGVEGVIEAIPLPTSTDLATYSQQVALNNRWTIPNCVRTGLPPELKHVVYIIRENKTYDEEFGDEPGGDPAGLLYGRAVTPNSHALAERYALLEDFSTNEELSDTGHHALFGGVVNDFIERESQQGYGLDQAPRLSLEDVPGEGNDVGWSPGAYLIDDALAHGLSFKDYGEFYRESQSQAGPAVTAALDAHIVHDFPGFGFNLGVKDTDREAFWEQQFAADVRNGTFPALEVIYLPTDHTSLGAASLGNANPAAEVADNDLATGRIVQALSNSPYWSSTAVFLTEDDPQSGIDHVDVHRTIGLVASPFVRHGLQSTRHFDQAGMLRTMEQILGLPPMTEFDAVAQPMTDLFQSTPVPDDHFAAQTPFVQPLPTATASAMAQLSLQLIGPKPDLHHVSSSAQLQIEWFAVFGVPYSPPTFTAAVPQSPTGLKDECGTVGA